MSDFDLFSANDEKQEIDPVADFLSREEEQLAELNDLNAMVSEPLDISAETKEPASDLISDGNMDFFGQPSSENVANYEALDSNKDLQMLDTAIFQSDRYAAMMEDGPPRAETDKIRKWQEEQKEKLILKDAESEKRQREWLQMALQDHDEYQRHREEMVNKAKKNNKQAEVAFVRDRDEKKPGGEWERVCRFCDFNPKSATRATKDVSRMRSILLQLKQIPNATFAA